MVLGPAEPGKRGRAEGCPGRGPTPPQPFSRTRSPLPSAPSSPAPRPPPRPARPRRRPGAPPAVWAAVEDSGPPWSAPTPGSATAEARPRRRGPGAPSRKFRVCPFPTPHPRLLRPDLQTVGGWPPGRGCWTGTPQCAERPGPREKLGVRRPGRRGKARARPREKPPAHLRLVGPEWGLCGAGLLESNCVVICLLTASGKSLSFGQHMH